MPMSDACAVGFAALLFNATTFANIAVNATSSPLTNLYVSLHTADPGAGGTQTTSEIGYTSYARVAVARPAGWVLTGDVVNPAATITFPIGTGGSGTATFGMIGSLASGAGVNYLRGPVAPSIVTGNGITPQLPTSTAFTFLNA